MFYCQRVEPLLIYKQQGIEKIKHFITLDFLPFLTPPFYNVRRDVKFDGADSPAEFTART